MTTGRMMSLSSSTTLALRGTTHLQVVLEPMVVPGRSHCVVFARLHSRAEAIITVPIQNNALLAMN